MLKYREHVQDVGKHGNDVSKIVTKKMNLSETNQPTLVKRAPGATHRRTEQESCNNSPQEFPRYSPGSYADV